jgi:uncharacterized metal-binding protein
MPVSLPAAPRAARRMSRDGKGKMYCLAGIGGRLSGIMKTTEAAESILAIDGCSLHCVKKCVEQAGFSKFGHLEITAPGLSKDQTPITDEAISKVAEAGQALLSQGVRS